MGWYGREGRGELECKRNNAGRATEGQGYTNKGAYAQAGDRCAATQIGRG